MRFPVLDLAELAHIETKGKQAECTVLFSVDDMSQHVLIPVLRTDFFVVSGTSLSKAFRVISRYYCGNTELLKRLMIYTLILISVIVSKLRNKTRTCLSNAVVLTANKKFKVFSTLEMVVLNVQKSNCKPDWFQSEIQNRTKCHRPFVLGIQNAGDQFYVEPYCEFENLARLSLDSQAVASAHVVEHVFSKLHSVRDVSRASYVRFLRSKLHCVEWKDSFPEAFKAATLVDLWLSRLSDPKAQIRLTESHGDFKAGNILFDPKTNDFLVLDWETASLRSQAFDRVTFHYNIRSANFWDAFLEFAADAQRQQRDFDDASVPVFLAEELLWRMDEFRVEGGDPQMNIEKFRTFLSLWDFSCLSTWAQAEQNV